MPGATSRGGDWASGSTVNSDIMIGVACRPAPVAENQAFSHACTPAGQKNTASCRRRCMRPTFVCA